MPQLSRIDSALDDLRTEIESRSLHVRLLRGAEYYLDVSLFDRLAAAEIIRLGESNMFLIEFPHTVNADLLCASLFRLAQECAAAQLTPLLAHPERYNGKDFVRWIAQLSQYGFLFQMDLLSLSHRSPRHVGKQAVQLLERQAYYGFGSDVHRPTPSLEAELEGALDQVERLGGRKSFGLSQLADPRSDLFTPASKDETSPWWEGAK